jgi:tripartite-type tricarboxylate transporter receptor subunit TctC
MNRFLGRHRRPARLAVEFFAWASLLCAGPAYTQTADRGYPARPITLIVPFAPGNTDVLARLFLQKISENTGWSFIYDYKPGASSSIGSAAVARAKADGYTMLLNTPSLIAVALSKRRLTYDWKTDLQPVYQMTRTPYILMVSASLPIKSLKDYVAYGKAHPGKINYATTGTGSIGHLFAAWMHGLMGVEVTYIPYKGYAPVATAIISGEVDAASPTYKSFHSYITAGKLRALAVTAANARIRQLPALKSIAEEGYSEYDSFTWAGIFVPTGTPLAIINRLNAEFSKAADSPDVTSRLDDLGEVKGGGSHEAFARFLVANGEVLARIVKERGIQIDE